MDKEKLIQEAYLVAHKIEENGNFPNNPTLPLMIYKGTLRLHPDDNVEAIKKVFAQNGYTNAWVDGIFDYHHYHSNTHEVMGVFCGKADVQFGGDHGVCIELDKGGCYYYSCRRSTQKAKFERRLYCSWCLPKWGSI